MSSAMEDTRFSVYAVPAQGVTLPRLEEALADDPGAGKTIMAGLYVKELILRSDCERAVIVAPGGLAEQWREELSQKFDLRFEVFNRQMVDDAQGRNVFAQHPYLIVRMDQVSRSDDLMEQLSDVTWDRAQLPTNDGNPACRQGRRFSAIHVTSRP